jgi:hypothetical protein
LEDSIVLIALLVGGKTSKGDDMKYRIVNLCEDILLDLRLTLGESAIKCIAYHDASCVDVDIDPSISILKINDGNLTIDVGAKLFTIPYEDYSSIEII